MNKNIRDIENKGLLKAFLKNEYPRYMSKDFSEKVMTDIYSQKTNNSAKTYLIRVASALVFGIFTLTLMDNMVKMRAKPMRKCTALKIKPSIVSTI